MNLSGIARALGVGVEVAKTVIDYMQTYRRINTPVDDTEQFKEVLAESLVDFQRTAGIPALGWATPETVEIMTMAPRCGNPDIQRVGEFAANWRKKDLAYFIKDYVDGLTKEDQDGLVAEAFGFWAAVADIRFKRAVSGSVPDLVISTGRGRGQNFDGPSGTLAYAYMPNGTDKQLLMRFDLDEKWVKGNPQGGILFLNVATHEFGHLLGMDHSRVSTALMAPFYSPSVAKPQAHDDIPRIQALYGAPTTPPVGPPPSPPKTLIEITGTYRVIT